MVKVLMIHRIFPTYRKPIYDRLAAVYDYILLHGKNDAGIQLADTGYSRTIKAFQYTKNPTNLLLESFSPLFKFRPKAVIHESSIGMLTILPMYVCAKMLGAKFILYGHGYNRFNGFNPRKSWADKYRAFLMRIADAVVIYTETDKRMLSEFADSKKIFVAQNTLDATTFTPIKKRLDAEGKAAVKARLGFTHKYNLTFIGRMLDEKMPDKVLEVFAILNKKLPHQIGIHFLGGGDVSHLEAVVKAKNWTYDVKFYGSVYDDAKTGAFLFASDLMIMPGYLGLAVNHAFLFDCPVVSFSQTTEGPFHSPEIEYVKEGETGFLIPELSVSIMARKIESYLQDAVLQLDMVFNIKKRMAALTPELMVKGFTDAVDFALKK